MGVLRIMIADDHRMFREGLRKLFEGNGDFNIVAEAEDGVDCLAKIVSFKPDYLLLDISMPRLDGLSVLQKIKEKIPKQKVILVTQHSETDYLYKAYVLGINGYVLKSSGFSNLLKAIEVSERGEQYIEPVLIPALKDMIDSQKQNVQEDTSVLTKRELQVLKLVAEGLYNKEIASRLGVSEKTVKNHITSLFKKINVSDRTQAAVYAIKNGHVNMD